MNARDSIGAVVVTFNRIDLLQQCVAALRQQTLPPAEIIIVDNSSTDGTGDWLASQPDLTVITQANLGGAGGFNTGMKAAYQKGHSWVWCMDDDTIPDPDALFEMARIPSFSEPSTGFIASVVLWKDRSLHRGNVQAMADASEWLPSLKEKSEIRIFSSTFISMMIKREAIAELGYPIKDFFIWFDDSEFCSRLRTKYKGALAVNSHVVHATPVNSNPAGNPIRNDAFKHCYGIRNLVYLHRHSDQTTFAKTKLIALLFLAQVGRVLQGKKPLKILYWFFKGLFFNPPIEKAV